MFWSQPKPWEKTRVCGPAPVTLTLWRRMIDTKAPVRATIAGVASARTCANDAQALSAPAHLTQGALPAQQGRGNRRGEGDQQHRHRHDHLGVLQADSGHEQVAEAALGAEHLAED